MSFFEIFPFVSFLLFSILIFGRTILLKKRGVRVSSKSAKSRKLKFILHPVFLLIMHLWMFEISRPVIHFSLLPKVLSSPVLESIALQVIGTVLILVSLIFLIATLISFKNSLRFGMHSNNLGKLITNGIFAVSRNPFFVSVELLILGNALFLPNPFLLGIAAATIVSIHFFILKEEVFMSENYGEEYKNYSKKVKRYF